MHRAHWLFVLLFQFVKFVLFPHGVTFVGLFILHGAAFNNDFFVNSFRLNWFLGLIKLYIKKFN